MFGNLYFPFSFISHLNFPLSIISPPKDVPCPPINFVAEYIIISTPHLKGENIKGETVLSTIKGILFS